MKYLEIIPDFLSKYGVFTSPNTSQIRQEMSISESIFVSNLFLNYEGVSKSSRKSAIIFLFCKSGELN